MTEAGCLLVPRLITLCMHVPYIHFCSRRVLGILLKCHGIVMHASGDLSITSLLTSSHAVVNPSTAYCSDEILTTSGVSATAVLLLTALGVLCTARCLLTLNCVCQGLKLILQDEGLSFKLPTRNSL